MGMAGEGRETSLFTMGCCAHSALGLSDFPALGLGNVKKKKKKPLFQHFLFVAPGCAAPLPITS